MALPTPFSVANNVMILRSNQHGVSTPGLGFHELGALSVQGEDDGDFNDFCYAIRELNERCENDADLADHIAVMLNRAYAYGLKQATVA